MLLSASNTTLLEVLLRCDDKAEVSHSILCVLNHLEDKLRVVKAHVLLLKATTPEHVDNVDLLLEANF